MTNVTELYGRMPTRIETDRLIRVARAAENARAACEAGVSVEVVQSILELGGLRHVTFEDSGVFTGL